MYSEYQFVFDGFAGPFTLGPTSHWSGGAADCTAYVWLFPDVQKPLKGAEVLNYSVEP